MKRVDRIMSKVLGVKNDVNQDVIVDANLTLAESPAMACTNEKENIDNGYADEAQQKLHDANLTLAVSPTLLCTNEENIDNGYIDEAQQGLHDLDSPMAPIFSPLTPLISKKKEQDTNILDYNEILSPLPPMSPETLKLFNTLSATDYLSENDNIRCEDLTKISLNSMEKNHSDFSADTDSEYFPNSDSSSDEDDVLTVKSLINKQKLKNKTDKASSSNMDIVHDQDSSEPPLRGIDNDNTDCESMTNDDVNGNDVHDNMERLSKEPPIRGIIDGDATDCETPTNNDVNSIDINIENDTEECRNLNSQGRPKKGRKRKNTDHTVRQTKQRKYSNLPYHNTVQKHIPSKQFHDFSCNCIRKCHLRVSKEKRLEEFQKYIGLGSYEAQLLFIVNCVSEEPKKRTYTINKGKKTNKKRPREFSRTYTLGGTEVCRNMFINNLQITTKKVDVSLKKNRSGNTIKDKRGHLQGGWNKTNPDDIDFVKNVIHSLPKYESHYRREQTDGIKYLKLGMTLHKIYDLYLEKIKAVFGEAKKPLSFAAVKQIFYKFFNLRCRSLKKDTCTRCDVFTNKIKNCSSNEEKEKLKNEKANHLKKAEKLRQKMKEDLSRAATDEELECLTFDLEKTLPLPRIPTSIVFYKRQLWLYNCGIHTGSDDTGYCYVWIEGEAGRGAQEVGSCLINFIKNKLDSKVKNLVLWSDCCGGQNRNIKIVLMLKTILICHPTLQTITLKYLESGHTFLPNDTDFSKIESQLKYHERIYTAEEYMNVFKNAKKKKPLQVTKMKKEDFLSSKKIESKIVNRKTFINKTKTNWLQTKEIMMNKEKEHIIYMKKDIEDEYEELNIEKKQKGHSLKISENDFTVLWPTGKKIPQPKLDDLKSMFHLIPNDCIDFYKCLQGDTSLIDDIEGYGGAPDFLVDEEEHVEEEVL